MSLPVSPRREDRANGPEAEAGLSPAVVRVLLANHHRFLGFLERRVGRRDLAEELLQEALARGIARGQSLRDDESVVAWFYRLLRNVMIDHLRRQSAEARGRAAFAREETVGAGAEPDQELVDTVCACVTSLVGTLRPDYAAAIQRVDLGGESLQSFATAANITRGNAAVRLFRARQSLRLRVEQSCGTCATHGCYQCECAAEAHPPG
jgi:RNA polymerase sigma-70 factor (ECF subfamily)